MKHLPEDFLLASELVVERPPREARRLGQSSMFTDPKPLSRNKRAAASTMASRDPPRPIFATVPFDLF